jgi:hypothetical protein
LSAVVLDGTTKHNYHSTAACIPTTCLWRNGCCDLCKPALPPSLLPWSAYLHLPLLLTIDSPASVMLFQ